MISSCSPWMVATMSVRRPVRAVSRAVNSAPWPVTSRSPVVVGHAEAGEGVAEELVLDRQQLAASGGEVTAAGEAHGLAAGGPVEGLGDRGPPVDDDGLLLGVADRDAADVEGLGSSPGASGARSMRPKHRAASPSCSWVRRLTTLS